MKRAVLSPLGERVAPELISWAKPGESFPVVKEVNGKCNCGYEYLDPDSFHTMGCREQFATIKRPDGEEQIVLRSHIKVLS